MPRNRFCKQGCSSGGCSLGGCSLGGCSLGGCSLGGCSLGKAKQAYWILISEALLGKGGGEKDDVCP